MFIHLFLVLGLVFGIFAALVAYLITYGEYRHHYQGSKQPRRLALQAAVFTFVVFFLIALLGGYVLVNFIINK